MFFDFRGKRRFVLRTVYLVLAVLFVGSLLLVGTNGQDGLGSLLGRTSVESDTKDRVKDYTAQLKTNDKQPLVWEKLMKARYQLALVGSKENEDSSVNYTEQGRTELEYAGRAWLGYRESVTKPTRAMLNLAMNIYGPRGLDRPSEGYQVGKELVRVSPSAESYYILAVYSAQVGDTRTSQLSGDKALELADTDEKKILEENLKELQQATE